MNDSSGGHRGQRRAIALAATALIAVLVAACGGQMSSSASATTQRSGYQQNLAYARCVQAHGLTNFPDPSRSGNANISTHLAAKPGSPAARATAACNHLLSGTSAGAGSGTTAATPGSQSGVAADCLTASH